MNRCLITTLALLAPVVGLADDEPVGSRKQRRGNIPAEQVEFFEREVRPLLVKHCFECHSAKSKPLQGGLRLDTREATRRGGESGAAVSEVFPEVASHVDDLCIVNSMHCTNPRHGGAVLEWHTGTDTGFGRDWDYQVVWNRPRHPDNSGHYFYDQLIETNGGKAKLTEGYSTDNYTNWAVDYIKGENRQADKPWYLWLCYGAVHGPFTPAKRHLDIYPGIRVPTPKDIFPPRPGKPDYMQKIEYWVKDKNGRPELKGGQFGGQTVEGAKGIHGNTLTDWVRQYHQGVRALDESVGTLIKTLKATGQYENTLVVFTSDQGFGWGQHGFCRKIAPYDGTIRSPLIISMPGRIPQGKVCRHPVAGVDLVPTFFRFADMPLPWDMHGHDLSPLLRKPGSKWDHPTLAIYTQRKYGADTNTIPPRSSTLDSGGVPWWVSLAKGRYKYIRTMEANQIEELYDLKKDPDELRNLALEANHNKRLVRFRTATVRELTRTKAGLVTQLPPVRTIGR